MTERAMKGGLEGAGNVLCLHMHGDCFDVFN